MFGCKVRDNDWDEVQNLLRKNYGIDTFLSYRNFSVIQNVIIPYCKSMKYSMCR